MRSLLLLPVLTLACATAETPAPAPSPLPAAQPVAAPLFEPKPVCPGNDDLSAMGSSTEGRQAALENAKRNLLTSKLGNAIHVEAESFSRLVHTSGEESAEYRDVQRVLERGDFAHPDLIQFVDAPSRGKEVFVAACLPRRQAIARLENDLAGELKRFDTWDAAAQEAQTRGDRPAFVAAMSNLAPCMAVVAPTLVQIRALAGGPAQSERHLTSRWLALVEASAKMRSQVRFVLDVQAKGRLQPAAMDITESFRRALVPLGNEVRLAAACPAAAEGTYLIRVSADADCGRGSLGTSCRPVLDVSGEECASGRTVFRSGLERIKANAADPSSEERALRSLVKKLDSQAIKSELHAALQAELPGEEKR